MQQQEDNGLGLMTTGFQYGNFDPGQIQEDEVILLVMAMDVSGSVAVFIHDMNEGMRGLVEELQKSHVAPKIMVKSLEFGRGVRHRTAFMPIAAVDVDAFHFKATDGETALFQGALEAVEAAVGYKAQLEATGINCKVLVFVVTDGEDNASRGVDTKVAKAIDDITKDEANMFTFETILFGVGDQAHFEAAQKAMHFKHMVQVGATGKDIRKLIGFISQSVSRSASNQSVVF